jgi:hypothetical protein
MMVATEAAEVDDAIASAEAHGFTHVLLRGLAAPDLDAPDDGLARMEAVVAGGSLLAIELPALPLGAAQLCFDPADPAADPVLSARADAVSALLDARAPALFAINPGASPAPWEVACDCTGCDGTDAAAMGLRAAVSWEALAGPVRAHGVEAAMVHAPPWPPRGDDGETAAALDAAVAALDDRSVALLSSSSRGPDSPWAPAAPRLADGAVRRVLGEVDPRAEALGAAGAVRVDAFAMHDRVRSQRAGGVVGWSARAVPENRAEDGNLAALATYFRDFEAQPEDAVAAWVVTRFGVDPSGEDGAALVAAFLASGPALAQATFPFGIAPETFGLPSAFPMNWVDPSTWDPSLSERYIALTDPDLSTLADLHVWLAEPVAAAERDLLRFDDAADSLEAADVAALRPRFVLSALLIRTRAVLAEVDATRRAFLAGAEDVSAGWLRDDITTLLALADDIDAAALPASLEPPSAEQIRDLADQLIGELAPDTTPSAPRPFPRIVEVSRDFADGVVNYYWRIDPPGSGWVERGPRPGVIDSEGQHGAGPAATWHAWSSGIGPAERVNWRPCGEAGGYSVCGADRVLWTPP